MIWLLHAGFQFVLPVNSVPDLSEVPQCCIWADWPPPLWFIALPYFEQCCNIYNALSALIHSGLSKDGQSLVIKQPHIPSGDCHFWF